VQTTADRTFPARTKEKPLANITLVDDDENIVASVSLALESHGHTVTAYHDGASGLEALETTPPDLAILDVKMPRMDGIDFLGRLMRLRPMPVVMVSTLTQAGTDVTLAALEVGAVDAVAKPAPGVPVQEAFGDLADGFGGVDGYRRSEGHCRNGQSGNAQGGTATKLANLSHVFHGYCSFMRDA